MCGCQGLSGVTGNAGVESEAVLVEAVDYSAGGTIVADTQSTASAPRIDAHHSTGESSRTQEDSKNTRNIIFAIEPITSSETVAQDASGLSQSTQLAGAAAAVDSFHDSWAAKNSESEESEESAYSEEVSSEDEDRHQYSHGDNKGQEFEETKSTQVPPEHFIIEDIEDDANPDHNIQTVQPNFYEDARSEESQSQADSREIYDRLKELHIESSTDEEEEQLRRYRRKKKRWSKGLFKRSRSESATSDNNSTDNDCLEGINATNRRVRRRVREPHGGREPPIFEESNINSVQLQDGFFTKPGKFDVEYVESNLLSGAELPFADSDIDQDVQDVSESAQGKRDENTPRVDLDGCENVSELTRATDRVAGRITRKHLNTAYRFHEFASSDEEPKDEPKATVVSDSHTISEGDYFGEWSSPSVSSLVDKAGSATRLLEDDIQRHQPPYDSNMPGFEPHTGPETPNILVCDVDGCGAVYLGADRRADLVRHNRQMHQNSYPQYHCEDTGCDRVYLSLDARLEHYGKDHPHLVQRMSSQLRQLSLSMDATTPPSENKDTEQWLPRGRETQTNFVSNKGHEQHVRLEVVRADPNDSSLFGMSDSGKTQQHAGDSTLPGSSRVSVIGPLYQKDAILCGAGETRNKVEDRVTDSRHTSTVQGIDFARESDVRLNEVLDGFKTHYQILRQSIPHLSPHQIIEMAEDCTRLYHATVDFFQQHVSEASLDRRMQLERDHLDGGQLTPAREIPRQTWTPVGDNAHIDDTIEHSKDSHKKGSIIEQKVGDIYQSDTGDASSASASCAASVISVFSIESLASSASDLSKANGYSAVQIATATKVLISIFYEDEVLLPLYRFAIENPVIGPERLQRNLRRLIKAYADHLDDEAKDRLEYLASRLVSIKSRWLAQSIVEKLCSKPLVQRPDAVPEQQDESSDDELDERPVVSETVFEDLVVFREFLTGSNAFDKLRTQVRLFVFPKSADITAAATSQLNLSREKLTSTSPEPGVLKRQTWGQWRGDIINFMDGLLRLPIDLRKVPLSLSLYLLVDAAHLVSDRILIQTGLLEPPLHSKKTRLRWNCGCGERLMSDVTELRQGGVAELTARMEQHSGVKVSVTRYSQGTSNQQYIVPQPGRWIRNGINKFAAALTGTSKPAPCLPQHNTSCPSSTRTSSQTTISQPSILHLLACMHQNRFRKVLQQDRIETIETDRALLCFMRQQYKFHRGRIMHFFSLKSVKGIFFVKFRLPLGGSVDVRHHDPCCVSALTTQSGCECIPPKEKVEPSPQAEYRCIPGPPASYPPVPPEYLKSIFMCPTDVHEKDTWILNQLPKRTCGELQGQIGQPADGWGIYYQDDWDRDAIFLFIFIILCFASLVFAVLYSRFQHDVQAAFGVSAYIVALVTVLLSLIGSRLERLG